MTEKKYATMDYLISTYVHHGEDVISLLRKLQAVDASRGIWKTLLVWGTAESVFCQIIADCDPEDGYAALLHIHDKIKQEILKILCVADEIELQRKYGAAILEPDKLENVDNAEEA